MKQSVFLSAPCERVLCALLGLTFLGLSPASAAAQSEEEQVLGVVQQFFSSMTAQDTAAARSIMLLEGVYFGVREDSAGVHVTSNTHRRYLQRLPTGEDEFVERMWEATVMIHGRIAMVWTPYDFHIDGEFSHCGVDSFSLVKTEEGWKISGIIYTVERTDCADSPLGPLGGE